ncbi:hypothetical protein [Paenibacillus daejeonensis]|uniref:hypothetical protein n=1 Tax=Paenibacillus daejeonensis TaxID=135193 RepID=UPI0009FEBDA0|nr:hypothetical protein [Paenibacillus daejeonensis]
MLTLKRLLWISLIVGVLIIIFSFVKHPGIPFQDPTVEMLLEYNKEANLADDLQYYGLLIAIGSICAIGIMNIIIKFKSITRRS